jgi:hypothetical protein
MLSASAAESAPITFFGEDSTANGSLPVTNSAAAEADFLAHLVGVVTEDFEAIPVGTTFPIVTTFGADTATLSGTSTISNTGVQATGIAGRFAISGSRYLNVGTTDSGSFTLTFSSPQAAFGFYATDIGDVSGQLAIVLDGGTPMLVPHSTTDGGALFFGVIDVVNPFTTVTFVNTTGSLADAFGFDDFTIGRPQQVVTPTPEPATISLVGFALFGAAAQRYRRRQQRP